MRARHTSSVFVAVAVLALLYFHAVMPTWEFVLLLLLVGVPTLVTVSVLALSGSRQSTGEPAQDEGRTLGETVEGVASPESHDFGAQSRTLP